jgi:23S rRNA (cytidine2498-2'-O)-methyltransferase
MHLLLAAEDSVPELYSEIQLSLPGVKPTSDSSSVVELDFPVLSGQRVPYLAYARQFMPDARPVHAQSIRTWAAALYEAVVNALPDNQPWRLHLEPKYHSKPLQRIGARAWHTAGLHRSPKAGASERLQGGKAGQNRCSLIRDAFLELLQKRRRTFLRQLNAEPEPFSPADSLVQLLLTSPEAGFLSIARTPIPFEQRHLISPFPKGDVKLPVDKAAPSRAFAKLLEAEVRMGRSIKPGEICVDLGAAPGSWTYVGVGRGARVIAVDRSPLVEDLMRSPLVDFRSGDAFRFQADDPADWLLCDVIAAPERTAELLLRWLRGRWCRHFVVTIKMKDQTGRNILEKLKMELPAVCTDLFFLRLCANKREVCAFGSV